MEWQALQQVVARQYHLLLASGDRSTCGPSSELSGALGSTDSTRDVSVELHASMSEKKRLIE